MKSLMKKIDRELLAYLFFGGLVTVISIAVYKICMELGYNSGFSNTVSSAVGITVAYITNKIWVFRARSADLPTLLREFFLFVSGRLFTYVLETALLILLVDYWGFWDLLCKSGTTVLVVVLNYIISKLFVFN